LLLLPVALVLTLAAGAMMRRIVQIDAKLHWVDFVGVGIVLAIAYFAIPMIY